MDTSTIIQSKRGEDDPNNLQRAPVIQDQRRPKKTLKLRNEGAKTQKYQVWLENSVYLQRHTCTNQSPAESEVFPWSCESVWYFYQPVICGRAASRRCCYHVTHWQHPHCHVCSDICQDSPGQVSSTAPAKNILRGALSRVHPLKRTHKMKQSCENKCERTCFTVREFSVTIK